jgi:hypothetical protein
MVDISLPQLPARGSLITPAILAKAIAVLLALLLVLGWSVVDTERVRCEFKQNGFSTGFNAGFDRASCNCKPFTIGRSAIGCDWIPADSPG